MPLTDIEKISIRRHLGYPVSGVPTVSPGGGTLATGFVGYRYFQAYGTLEYRMNHLMPAEESVITGIHNMLVTVSSSVTDITTPVGSGLSPAIRIFNDDVDETLTINTDANDTIYTLGTKFSNAVQANANLFAESFYAVSPLQGTAYNQAARPPATVTPFPGIQITSPNEFTVEVTNDAPVTMHAQNRGISTSNGPSAIIDETQVFGYLPIISALESAVAGASDNLDVKRADVWTAREDEVPERVKLYNHWRRKLARFISIPIFEDTGLDPSLPKNQYCVV